MAINTNASNGTVEPSAPNADEESPLLRDHTAPKAPEADEDSVQQESAEQLVLPEELSTKRVVITLGTIYVGVFLGALDATMIATLAAPISTSFASLSLLSWLASAYLIANAACQPLSGRLTDIFTRRTGLVVSNILFAAGNLICGLATNEWSMITGRVVAGMGGGGLMAISSFVSSDLVPLRKRGLVQGIGNICYGAGSGLGGIYGGWVNDVWGWRVAFLSQVPLVVLSGIMVFFLVQIPAKKSDKSKLSRVDFRGSFTLLVTIILLLLGLNSGGNVVPWSHPLVLVSLTLSMVALAVFIYIQAYVALEPVIPVRLLQNRTVAAACLTNCFTTMSMFMIIFYTPIFFQVKGSSTTAAGMRLIPLSLGSSVGSLGSGLLMNYTGKYKILGRTVIVLFILGAGLLTTLTFHTPDWPGYFYQFLVGVGYGGMLTVTLLATIAAVAHEHQAVITSATYAFRSTGSTIGVTIASAVYQNILVSSLHSKFDGKKGAASEIRRIRNSLDELKHLPKGWETGVYDSYEVALRCVFLTALGIAIPGLICGVFMRQHTLHSSLARRD